MAVNRHALLLCLLLLAGTATVCAQPNSDDIHRRFAERLVSYSEQGTVADMPVSDFMRAEKIVFMEGGFAEMKRLCNDTSASMELFLADGKRYLLRFYRDSSESVALSYPADYRIIFGVTMLEAEDMLEENIRISAIPSIEESEVPSALLQPLGLQGETSATHSQVQMSQPLGSVYLLKGNQYLIPELNNDRFYVKVDKERYELLYAEDYPCETMQNLVTGIEIATNLQMTITLVKYGYRTQTFTVPLRQWVSYCLSEGCTPYFGVIGKEADKVLCEVVMHNEMLGYAHIAKLQFNPSVLVSGQGVVTARMNSYIPLSNVKSVFGKGE